MESKELCKKFVLGSLIVAQSLGQAAPYVLSQVPQNTALTEPPPNVILSIDNSGSMSLESNSPVQWTPRSAVPSRIEALKQALRNNFSSAAIADGEIRLAWQALNNARTGTSCVGFLGDTAAPQHGATPCTLNGVPNANSMRLLDREHRNNLMTWVDNLSIAGQTPLPSMLTRAGEYMKTTGDHNPYSNEPGTPGAPIAACRKTFHILMTDGETNRFGLNENPADLGIPNVGNADGTTATLPSRTEYVPRPPFNDDAGARNNPANWRASTIGRPIWTPTAEYRPTLADLTFSYWATDLQPDVPDRVFPITRVEGAEAVGGTTVPEFWNPKNDPATWQHMRTSVIGFGSAARWQGSPSIDAAAAQPTYSGDYGRLVAGTMSWPDPLAGTRQGVAWEQGAGYRHDPIDPAAADALRVDLWHAAINGRGTFTPASNAEALSKAFKTILSEIKEPKDPPLTSIAADSSKFRTGQFFYRGSYDRKSWTGDVLASRVQDDGTLRQAWSAKSQLDRRVEGDGFNTRTVLSSSAAGGIPFRWSNLSDAQKGALQGAPFAREMDSSAGQTALNFLRGQRAAEGTSSGGETWRVRASVLGDIVGSTIWYAGRPNDGFLSRGYAQFSANNASRPAMLYVGANDGMLHAFNATTGVETFAYVPQGLYGTTAASLLRSYTRSGYTHRYLVDGSPFVGDVYLGSASDAASPDTSNVDRWRSLLVGTLGAGGKGYFVLDVTDPAGVSEANAGSVVLIDTSAGTDPDIGHQFQQPTVGGAPRRAKQFVRLNNDRPALILGNGYNSSNEKAVLLVQYLDGDRSLVKLYTSSTESAGDGNGLSAPQMVDRNGDGKVDYVYAGDLKGRLWKFDLSSSEQRAWKATTGHTPEGSTTTDDQHLFQTDAGQPITAAPTVVAHPRGGFMVVFGTGRTFAADDWQTTTSQALYGVWDNSTGTVLKSNLVERNITQEGRPPQRFIPPAGVAFGGTDGKMGWFMALPQSGERLVYPSEALDGSTVLFNTLVPGVATDTVSCTEGKSDTGWVMVLDLFGGGSVGTNVFGSTDADSTSLVGYALTDASRVISQTIAASREKICDTLGNCRDVQHKKLGRRFAWRDLVPIK